MLDFSNSILVTLFSCIFISLTISVDFVHSKQFEGIPGLYCGLNNCYDVLGATRESTKDEIAKLYRAVAKKWHPDRFKSEKEKETATEKFRLIASAYETLKDPGKKQDYDDMLENPEDYYQHYYRYYKRAYGAKVDARLALAMLITLISGYQYWIQETRYNDAVNFLLTIPRYRNQALDLATKRGLWPPSSSHIKHETTNSKKRPNKKFLRILEEQTVRDVIVSEGMVVSEGYATLPDFKNILWVQLLLAPWLMLYNIIWFLRWIWKFNIKKQAYGLEEQIYLIKKNMKGLVAFCKQQEECSLAPTYLTNLLPDINNKTDLDWMLKQKLWREESFQSWRKRKEDEIKSALSQNACFKRYRRYMRKGGPSQITFLDD